MEVSFSGIGKEVPYLDLIRLCDITTLAQISFALRRFLGQDMAGVSLLALYLPGGRKAEPLCSTSIGL